MDLTPNQPVNGPMTAANSTVPSVVEAIGNTPLIRLQRASALTGCTILGIRANR
jgi:hypothetical protein